MNKKAIARSSKMPFIMTKTSFLFNRGGNSASVSGIRLLSPSSFFSECFFQFIIVHVNISRFTILSSNNYNVHAVKTGEIPTKTQFCRHKLRHIAKRTGTGGESPPSARTCLRHLYSTRRIPSCPPPQPLTVKRPGDITGPLPFAGVKFLSHFPILLCIPCHFERSSSSCLCRWA